jgi:hypothetical protein
VAAVARSQILKKFQSPILGRPAIDWAALVAAAEPGYIRKKPPSNASMRNDVFMSRGCAATIAIANAKERRPCLPHGETLAVPSLAECRPP